MSPTTMINGLSRALWDSDLVASRVSLAIAELLWAIMLFWPGDTFSRPTYSMMAQVMSEEAWGLMMLLSAVTQVTIVIALNFHSYFARVFAGWNACIWVFLILSMMLSVSPPPAAISGDMALAFLAVWIWCRPIFLAEGYRRAFRSAKSKPQPT